jgi:uncharacterized membrane protein
VVVTGLIHHILISAGKKKPAHFIRTFMTLTTLKLLVFVLLVLAYVFINRAEALGFAIGFLAMYLLFTVFEVTSLLKHFKQ